jgi:hypothetical protein
MKQKLQEESAARTVIQAQMQAKSAARAEMEAVHKAKDGAVNRQYPTRHWEEDICCGDLRERSPNFGIRLTKSGGTGKISAMVAEIQKVPKSEQYGWILAELARPDSGETSWNLVCQNPATAVGRCQISFYAVGNFFVRDKRRKIFWEKNIFSKKWFYWKYFTTENILHRNKQSINKGYNWLGLGLGIVTLTWVD